MSIKRRGFLAGIAAGTAGVSVEACSPAPVDQPARPGSKSSITIRSHQPGVTSIPSPAATLVGLDLTTTRRDQLRRLLELPTGRIRLLQRPADADTGVTITLAVGAGLFGERLGLSEFRPLRLTAMPPFPNGAPEASCTEICYCKCVRGGRTAPVQHCGGCSIAPAPCCSLAGRLMDSDRRIRLQATTPPLGTCSGSARASATLTRATRR
jgi:hypothetical protein